MDYDRIGHCIRRLALLVQEYTTDNNDTEDLWYTGEGGSFDLQELITGAYWHYSGWHGGQNDPGYSYLCILGTIFNPGHTSEDPDNEAMKLLDEMASNYFHH